jgi:hypothetical protein
MKAKELFSLIRQDREHFYSGDTRNYEKTVRWLKTPAGTLVKQIDYFYPEAKTKGFLCWKEHHSEKSFTETHPYPTPLDAIRDLMKETRMSMNEAAEKLELDGEW